MVEERSLTWHYVFRAAIMAGFCYYIVYLVRSDHLIYYIAPRMQVYVKLAAIALFAVAVHQLYMAFRSVFDKPEQCDCDHAPPRSVFANVLIYGLFLAPLALGFLMPDQIMGSSIASIKGMNLSSSGTVKQVSTAAPAVKVEGEPTSTPTPAAATAALSVSATEPPAATPNPAAKTEAAASTEDSKLKEMFKIENFNEAYSKFGMKLYKQDVITFNEKGFMETLTTMDLFTDNFVGKKVEISGFVYREDEMKSNQFVVARLAMQCCSADASPFGILVESSLASSFGTDSWVKITGVLGKTNFNGYDYMKLDAKSIEKIEAPKTPYVYPDYDFIQ